MSSVSPKVVAYLTRQLSRNPISESADIVALRAKALRLTKPKQQGSQPSAPAEQRQQLRDQLDTIRQQCFSVPVEQLLSQLDQMDLANYPDLAALAKRLRVILESRTKLPQLSSDKRFDGDFFSCLKTVLVSPSRDVTILREQVLASFRHRKNRKRGQAMIRMLRDELPALYALEADWLGSLAGYKSKASDYVTEASIRNQKNDSYMAWFGPGAWLFLVVVVTIGIVQSNFSKNDEPRTQKINFDPGRRTALEKHTEDTVRRGSQVIGNTAEQRLREQEDRDVTFVRHAERRHNEMIRLHRQKMKDREVKREQERAEFEARQAATRERNRQLLSEVPIIELRRKNVISSSQNPMEQERRFRQTHVWSKSNTISREVWLKTYGPLTSIYRLIKLPAERQTNWLLGISNLEVEFQFISSSSSLESAVFVRVGSLQRDWYRTLPRKMFPLP